MAIVFCAGFCLFSQNQSARIGPIEFFGHSGIDLEPVRAAIPVHDGDSLALTDEAIGGVRARIRQTIQRVVGHEPTDVAPVCCDDKGQWMIYIGLGGKSSGSFRYNDAPSGSAKLPPAVLKLYDEAMQANMEAVSRGASSEDDSMGYALSSDPAYRAKQLEMRQFALGHEVEIRRVLESSGEPRQRVAASELLGYAGQSKLQLVALTMASRDRDDNVRNNAIRALVVLASSNPKTAAQIPAEEFVPMLSSGSWTDRNKSAWLMEKLTQPRDPKLLDALRAQALDSLIEMARWRSPGHSGTSRMILGRIAGIEEKRLQAIVERGQVEEILSSFTK